MHNRLATSFDTTRLQDKGFQHLPNFFASPEIKADFQRRAGEILAARDAGKLSTNDQDAQGFGYDWYEPMLRDEKLVSLMTEFLGPDVCGSGWRILIKDKHYRGGFRVHQDWPYNSGDTNKITCFVPLTHINRDNGGLFFCEESHTYGPVSQGAIDLSRFPPLEATCPELNVGDVVICDFLTWHYSLAAVNEEERIMIQLNYQPAGDASSKNLVAGKMPHDRILTSRFDACAIPQVELNARQARSYYEHGMLDRATRFAKGLVYDDPDHVGASLLLYDILSEAGDPAALTYLDKAQGALRRLNSGLAERMRKAGEDAGEGGSRWGALDARWSSNVEGFSGGAQAPITLATPDAAWAFGAVSQLLPLDKPAAVRVQARAVRGEVAFCLVNEAEDELLSDHYVINPDAGATTLFIAFDPAKGPARLCIRNFNDTGVQGEVEVTGLHVKEYAAA